MRSLTYQCRKDTKLARATRAVREGMTDLDAERTFPVAKSTLAENVMRQKSLETDATARRHERRPIFSNVEKECICDVLCRFSERRIPLRRSNLKKHW